MSADTPMQAPDRYRDEFTRLEAQLAGYALPWLRRARRVAFERFAESGFPSTRDEDWKYTSVSAIEKQAFKCAPATCDGPSASQVNELALGARHLLVFGNGCYRPGHSRVGALPAGARIASLAAELADGAEQLQPWLAPGPDTFADCFAALNAALWADGAYLELAPHTRIEEPVHLLFITTEAGLQTHPRILIRAGAGSCLSVIEHYIGPDSALYFTNAATEIILGAGARVEHCKLQQEAARAFHLAGIHALQGPDSRFTSHSFALGAALSRNDISTRLDAEGCEATLNGLYLAGGRQHMDHHTRIDHAKPRGMSREFYKGVLDGAARAVFNGKVIIHPGAQKSDAHQSNRNLLLSSQAEVDTKPQLEIYADDVKCSHGATVSQLDENQVFYLRSRGMDGQAAKSLLTYAFAQEIVSRVGLEALQARLGQLVLERLAHGSQPGARS